MKQLQEFFKLRPLVAKIFIAYCVVGILFWATLYICQL